MKTRAERAGGSLEIAAGEHGGTVVAARLKG
jgi:signal transduction histidine kinase